MIKERVIDYQSTINVLYKFISECTTEFQLKVVWNAPEITRSQRPALRCRFLKNQVSKPHKNITRQNPLR